MGRSWWASTWMRPGIMQPLPTARLDTFQPATVRGGHAPCVVGYTSDHRFDMGVLRTICVASFALSAWPSAALAGEIKALVTIGFQSAIEELAPKFEKAT